MKGDLTSIIDVWLIYWWVVILAFIAGLTSIIGRLARKEIDASPLIIISELLASIFAGTLVLFFCISQGFDFAYTGMAVGAAGYSAGKIISVFESIIVSKVKQKGPL